MRTANSPRLGSVGVSRRAGLRNWATLAASWVVLGTLVSCGPRQRTGFQVELESARFVYEESSQAWTDFRGGSRRSMSLIREKVRVREVRVEPQSTLAGTHATRTANVRLVRFDRGEVWSRLEHGEHRRLSLAAEDYELENDRRHRSIDVLREVVETDLSANASFADFLPTGRVERRGVADPHQISRKRHVIQLADDPGFSWAITVARDVGSGYPPILPELIVSEVMGLSRERSRTITEQLGGFPVRFESSRLPREGEAPSMLVVEILNLQRAFLSDARFTPSEAALLRLEEAQQQLSADPKLWLDWIEHPERRSQLIAELDLLLEFGPTMQDTDVPRLRKVWRQRKDFGEKVDLMRCVLRGGLESAASTILAEAEGTVPGDVLAATEALIAEEKPEAKTVLKRMLNGDLPVAKQQAAGAGEWIEAGALEMFAMRSLRPGVPIEDVLAVTRGLSREDALAAEFAFWRRRLD